MKIKVSPIEGEASVTLPDELPAEILRDDDQAQMLVLYVGQLVQITTQRADKWAFGTVILDPEKDTRPALTNTTTFSQTTGWFHSGFVKHPTDDELSAFQKMMGGSDALDALATPPDWKPVKDSMKAQLFEVSTDEARQVHAAFFTTLDSSDARIASIQRVQNVAMWQSYAVKRNTILVREGEAGVSDDASRWVRKWLFHGTSSDTIPKIMQQGFNRAFAGKNAVMHGKGVYFARDAAYSYHYANTPDPGTGLYSMFLCRVAVGRWCLGVNGQLVPDVYDAATHTLYDTTAGDKIQATKGNPNIFVTYHDAQAYPEYLVTFQKLR